MPLCPDTSCNISGRACHVADYPLYDALDERLMKTAAVEADYYSAMCRADEIIEFCRRMDYRRIGLAFCGDLLAEGRIWPDVDTEFNIVIELCWGMIRLFGTTALPLARSSSPKTSTGGNSIVVFTCPYLTSRPGHK